MNQVETLDRDFTNPKTSANITLGQSTSVLNKCDIYDHMVSTTAKIDKTVLKNISSTSRPRDTVNRNQQNIIISFIMLNSKACHTWLGSISTGNCHNEVQKKYVGSIDYERVLAPP